MQPVSDLQPAFPELETFAAITLEELEAVALLERVDTKFALPEALLHGILASVAGQYSVLEIEGRRRHQYETLYFDTDDYLFYRAHHSGRRIRHKVRSRQYTESGTNFLEVKTRTGEYRTLKARIATGEFVSNLEGQSAEFVRSHAGVDAALLAPRLTNRFARITLASRTSEERVTIDTAISVATGQHTVHFSGIAVVEVKRQSHHAPSALGAALKQQHIRPTALSKYCIGIASLQAEPRHNAFKPVLRHLARLSEQTNV